MLDDLVGIWQDADSGCYVQLGQDGSYRYAQATLWLETAPADEGQYRLEGTTLTFSSSNGSRECTGQSGSYQLELTGQDQFQLVLLEDPCQLRAGYRPGPWERVPPTPELDVGSKVGSTMVREEDGMTVLYVPAGTFQMGTEASDPAVEDNETPQHPVTLDGFWIDRTEVTNAQYAGCVAAGACNPPYQSSSATRESYYDDSQYADYPVIRVTWDDAAAYCAWAGGRLPSEAEWEYAARGPEALVYPWGNDPLDEALLNYNKKVGDTTPVGSYAEGASWVGALDMAGNVAEWVNDWYAADYYAVSPAENPTGPDTGDLKAMRGGSWFNPSYLMRSAWRSRIGPDIPDPSVGFRCVVPATSSP